MQIEPKAGQDPKWSLQPVQKSRTIVILNNENVIMKRLKIETMSNDGIIIPTCTLQC